jgi:hypothetical protein
MYKSSQELVNGILERMGLDPSLVSSQKDKSSLNNNKCTEETEEINETKESEEPEESGELEECEETGESNRDLWSIIDNAISQCLVITPKGTNRPLFMLAHKIRGLEEEQASTFPLDVISEIVRRWQSRNRHNLEDNHDYLTEFLDKLSLVRHPKGRALVNAFVAAKRLPPPKQTSSLSRDVQLLACLCRELQRQAGTNPFFLDGRSAAKVLGQPHETVASWLRALRRLVVIALVEKGRRGRASRYRYIAVDYSPKPVVLN